MPDFALELVKVRKSFPVGKQSNQVIHDISLEINRGDFVSIVGPSGSGKSTLLHLMSGMDQPTQGNILIKNQNISKLSDKKLSLFRNQHFGFVFQEFHLLGNLTIAENISLPLLIAERKNVLTESEQKRLLDLMAELQIEHRGHHYPSQISGGQKQRAAIGRALINQPEIIFADEPTGNLDSQTGQDIIKVLRDIHQKRHMTLIIVTHDQYIARKADRIIEIKDGKIVKRPHTKLYTQ